MLTASRTRTIDDAIPIFSVESNQLVMQDGRVAVGFSVSSLETEKLSEQQYDAFNTVLTGTIKNLPDGTIIQKIDAYHFNEYQESKKDKTFFQRKIIDHFSERSILVHDSYLFISFGPPIDRERNAANTLYALGRHVTKNPLQNIDKRQRYIERIADDIVSSFSALDVTFTRLDDEGLKSLYLRYYNVEFNQDHQPTDALRTFAPESNHLAIGEKRVNIVTMAGQGGYVEPSAKNKQGVASPWTYPLTHYLYFPHVLSVSIKVVNKEKVLSSMDDTAKVIRNLDFMMTMDNRIKRDEILEFTDEVRSQNKTICELNVSVILNSMSDAQMEKQLQQTVAAFRDMGSSECFVESVDTANLFIANAPGNSDQNYRWLTVSGDNAAVYLNFITKYHTEMQGDLLCDRHGTPVLVNLFNMELSNQNALVVGPTGSGKSYTIAHLLVQRFDRGEPQIMIDNGGTYLSAFIALGGRYFEYDPDRPLKFNPFLVERLNDLTYTLSGDKSNFLINLLTIIWKGENEFIRQSERSILSELLLLYYTAYNRKVLANDSPAVPSLTDFYDFVLGYVEDHVTTNDKEFAKQAGSFHFNEFLICLKPFAVGQYKEILNSDQYEDLTDNILICFELKKIKENPLLYPVVGMLISELALDQLARYPTKTKWFYMDEAWSMLSDKMGDFVETMYRTVRKYKGSMCIITQGINEIISSPVGKAIIGNAATKIILYHDDHTTIQDLQKVLSFTDHEIDKILSLEKRKTYREIFAKQGEYGKVYRLELPYEVQAILTSKPIERDTLRELTAKYGDIFTAIREFVELKKSGKL